MEFSRIGVSIDMNQLKEALDSIIQLAHQYSEVSKEKIEKYGGSLSGENFETYWNDETGSKERTALIDALEALQYKDVIAIQAVMYIGRGDFDREGINTEQLFRDAYTYCYNNDYAGFNQDEKDNKKDIEISQIIQKAPLSKYLREGMRKIDL